MRKQAEQESLCEHGGAKHGPDPAEQLNTLRVLLRLPGPFPHPLLGAGLGISPQRDDLPAKGFDRDRIGHAAE